MSELKRILRREIKERIKNLDAEYCQSADDGIYEKIIELPEYKNASCIFCFVSTIDEIDTTPIIHHALQNGKSVVVPRCVRMGVMESYLIHSLDDLKLGSYGIMEPDINVAENVLPSAIDLAIIPCLSANKKGQRIGYGGGFYDRYLKCTEAYRMVLCRERIMCEDIPVEEHDMKMEMVVSEEEVVRTV